MIEYAPLAIGTIVAVIVFVGAHWAVSRRQ